MVTRVEKVECVHNVRIRPLLTSKGRTSREELLDDAQERNRLVVCHAADGGLAGRSAAGQLVATLLEAGEANEVFRVQSQPLPYRFDAATDGSFAVFVASTFAREQVLPLHLRSAQITARVTYIVPDGMLCEAEVADLGALLRSLRPEVVHRPRLRGIAPPLAIDLGTIDVRRVPLDAGAWWYFGVSLYTDIWLPWVKGGLEPDVEDERGNLLLVSYDNRPLAARHTLRLNQFLATLFAEVDRLGGAVETDIPELFYSAQIEEGGVRLDAVAPRPCAAHQRRWLPLVPLRREYRGGPAHP